MIRIKEIELYDSISTQAFYILTDGKHDLRVFQSYDFNQKENDKFRGELSFLDSETRIQEPEEYGTRGIFHSKINDTQILMGELTEQGLEIGDFIMTSSHSPAKQTRKKPPVERVGNQT